MGVPTPVVPTFTDGVVVHQADLNALGTNLTNLYNYLNAGFTTQKPCVIVAATSSQSIAASTDTLVTFQAAAVNTNNMWVAGSPTQITIQKAGIYWVFAQTHWPLVSGATLSNALVANLMVNGTTVPTNVVACQTLPMVNAGPGSGHQVGCLVNLAAGSTVFLDVWHNALGSISLQTDRGSTFFGAIFQTPST